MSTLDPFINIKILTKRCAHFIPNGGKSFPCSWLDRDLARYLFDEIEPIGMGVAAHNYALMQSPNDTRLEQLCWLDACAASFNRYIDKHLIADDANTKRCLRWWRRQLFFVFYGAAEGFEQVALGDLPSAGQGDLSPRDRVLALHGEQTLVDRGLDLSSRQLSEEPTGNGGTGTPGEIDDSSDADFLGHGEHLTLQTEKYARARAGVLDVTPATVCRLVLRGVILLDRTGGRRSRLVVAQERVDLRTGIVATLAGESGGQMPPLSQVVLPDQTVRALKRIRRTRFPHAPDYIGMQQQSMLLQIHAICDLIACTS